MLKFLAFLAAVMIIAVAVMVWAYPSNRDFGPDNASWNGLGGFCSDFQPAQLESLGELPASPQESALVLIPYQSFTEEELEQVRQYVADGGTMLLLDDYGYGNQVLEYLGVLPRFTNLVLMDPFKYLPDTNSYFPRADLLSSDESAVEERVIALNHASSLDLEGVPEDRFSLLANSSRLSYLDENDNSLWDKEEEKGPLPVACAMDYEAGHVVLIADPSILIMLEWEENLPFINEAISIGHASPAVLLDESHLPPTNLVDAKDALRAIRSALATPQGVVAMVLVVLAVIMIPVWRRRKPAVRLPRV
jgi:hypothetical protein